ncbi:MAG: hypothetical protein WCT05_03540 [Lentisphaeria bacterium]
MRYHSKREKLIEKMLEGFRVRKARAGERIASIRVLSAELGVTSVTTIRMLDEMVETGILLKEANRGYYLAHSFQAKPRIGCCGVSTVVNGKPSQDLANEASKVLFEHFRVIGCEPILLDYNELVSGMAKEKLSDLDGLLLNFNCLDAKTLPILQKFAGRIVVFNYNTLCTNISCSQVMTDFRDTIAEFISRCDIKQYERVLVISPANSNGLAISQIFEDQFCAAQLDKVDYLTLDTLKETAELVAYKYFTEHNKIDWTHHLVIVLSGNYVTGIVAALPLNAGCPDVLCFDNQEKHHLVNGLSEPYFTAVDRNMPLVFTRALDLLLELVHDSSRENHCVFVPATLVIRKSVKYLR